MGDFSVLAKVRLADKLFFLSAFVFQQPLILT